MTSERALCSALAGLIAPGLLVACAPGAPSSPGETTGTVEVTVVSTGVDVPDAYEVALGDEAPRRIPSNGSVSFPGIAPGAYPVELLSIPGNCGVEGANPVQAAVSEAATSPVAFAVACTAEPRGDLSVTTVTSGEDLDPDGYAVSIDGAPAEAVDENGTRVFIGLPVGDRLVELVGLADNCVVQGENPRTLPISDGETTPTTFAVVCVSTTGSIRVAVSTDGSFQDTDGYTIDLDGMRAGRVDPDGSVTFDEVEPGSHSVTLGDIRATCDVEDDNPADVEVIAGETADVEFEVECSLF